MKITISGEDKHSLKQVEDLARKLGLKILKKRTISKDKKNGAEMTKLMTEMAKSVHLTQLKIQLPGSARFEKIVHCREEKNSHGYTFRFEYSDLCRGTFCKICIFN